MKAEDNKSLSKMVEYAMLYDFYGALLKEKNRAIFEDYMFNDMSLSEIGDELGITRQGVRDIVERSRAGLVGYEEKLGLIKRFGNAKDNVANALTKVNKVRDILDSICNEDLYLGRHEEAYKLLNDIEDKLNEIIEEF